MALQGINKERDSTGNSNFHSDPTNLNKASEMVQFKTKLIMWTNRQKKLK